MKIFFLISSSTRLSFRKRSLSQFRGEEMVLLEAVRVVVPVAVNLQHLLLQFALLNLLWPCWWVMVTPWLKSTCRVNSSPTLQSFKGRP